VRSTKIPGTSAGAFDLIIEYEQAAIMVWPVAADHPLLSWGATVRPIEILRKVDIRAALT
jgi:hypothetical protein